MKSWFLRGISPPPSLTWTSPNLGPKSQETDLIYITVFGVKVIPRPFLLHPIKPVSHQWVTGRRCCRHHFLFFFSCVHTDLSALAGQPIGGGDIIEHQRKSLADRTGHESPWRRWTSLRMRHRVQEEERVVILTTNLMTHSLLVRMIWARAWTCFCFVLFFSCCQFRQCCSCVKIRRVISTSKNWFPKRTWTSSERLCSRTHIQRWWRSFLCPRTRDFVPTSQYQSVREWAFQSVGWTNVWVRPIC